MKRGAACWIAVCVLNLALASVLVALAPSQVGTTADRQGYEHVAQHGLAPDCPHLMFCYRVVLPIALAHVPLPEVTAWRAFTVVANATTGSLLAVLTVASGATLPGALLASILFQSSFGATFGLFDPFTPDAAVALVAAVLALCWRFDRPRVALLVAVVGVFAKEAVVLVISAIALASFKFARPRPWLLAAAAAWFALLSFHAVMDLGFGWTERGGPAADLLGGSWFGLWLADPTLTPASHALYLFIPFGFAWLYAALGVRIAPPRLRALANGALVLLPLLYVQQPERALATAAFAVVPLAALYLSRAPLLLALPAALANALLTARVGLSTPLLPPLVYSLTLAGILAAFTVVRPGISAWLSSHRALSASSRITSRR
jgi:hypothetical protein